MTSREPASLTAAERAAGWAWYDALDSGTKSLVQKESDINWTPGRAPRLGWWLTLFGMIVALAGGVLLYGYTGVHRGWHIIVSALPGVLMAWIGSGLRLGFASPGVPQDDSSLRSYVAAGDRLGVGPTRWKD
jgi:hypothetical protein